MTYFVFAVTKLLVSKDILRLQLYPKSMVNIDLIHQLAMVALKGFSEQLHSFLTAYYTQKLLKLKL